MFKDPDFVQRSVINQNRTFKPITAVNDAVANGHDAADFETRSDPLERLMLTQK